MKNILISVWAIMLLVMLLAPGCATRDEAVSSSTWRGYETRSWWGDDPTCSPGCPPSLPGGF